jgi:hypothetical protein
MRGGAREREVCLLARDEHASGNSQREERPRVSARASGSASHQLPCQAHYPKAQTRAARSRSASSVPSQSRGAARRALQHPLSARAAPRPHDDTALPYSQRTGPDIADLDALAALGEEALRLAAGACGRPARRRRGAAAAADRGGARRSPRRATRGDSKGVLLQVAFHGRPRRQWRVALIGDRGAGRGRRRRRRRRRRSGCPRSGGSLRANIIPKGLRRRGLLKRIHGMYSDGKIRESVAAFHP